MAAPSDYRHDPFSDVSTATTFTERHIIPSVSPYVINLNEIPQKNSPSTMTVKAITNVNGSTVTYGSTFAEVAANPSSNEFWPDYNTGADGDENWNTGKLLFNSSNAGQLVEIRYTATGTLAGVKSNRYPAWWLDRGDGSDGDFRPTGNTTISGLKQYRSVFIPAGVTVSADRYLTIKCQEACIINGIIRADGTGAAGGGVGEAGSNGNIAGGAGGATSGNQGAGGAGTKYNEVYIRIGLEVIGAGGGGGGPRGDSTSGSGGRGGGCIYIVANEINISGSISANGTAGGNAPTVAWSNGGGGGGGGCICLVANTIYNNGSIIANGGSGGSGNGASGARGSDGVVEIVEMGVM